MSASIWLEIDTGGPEPLDVYCNVNVTYNLSPMLRAAGLPPWESFKGAPASEAGGVFRSVAERLRAAPERFEALNPPNGWGTYEGAVEALEQLAEVCAAHPRARLAVCE